MVGAVVSVTPSSVKKNEVKYGFRQNRTRQLIPFLGLPITGTGGNTGHCVPLLQRSSLQQSTAY